MAIVGHESIRKEMKRGGFIESARINPKILRRTIYLGGKILRGTIHLGLKNLSGDHSLRPKKSSAGLFIKANLLQGDTSSIRCDQLCSLLHDM